MRIKFAKSVIILGVGIWLFFFWLVLTSSLIRTLQSDIDVYGAKTIALVVYAMACSAIVAGFISSSIGVAKFSKRRRYE